MADRSRRSIGWPLLIAGLVLVVAIIAWLLFAGAASTPTVEPAVDLTQPALPDGPPLPPVEPPTLPSPTAPPSPVG